MARPKPGTKPPCPFCGAPPRYGEAADQHGHIDWRCGSGQHGEEPRQDTHCEANCEINALEAELAWCHAAMDGAHQELNPEVPAPDWHTAYESLKAAAEGLGRQILESPVFPNKNAPP